MNGSGLRDTSCRLSTCDLPNSRNLQRNISRHQGVVIDKIQAAAQQEMDLPMTMEIKEITLHEEGEEFYNAWIKKYQV